MPEATDRQRSARLAIRVLVDPDLPLRPDDRDHLVDSALWRLTEYDRNRYKYLVRYRSRAVVEGPPAEIRHEHVVPRDWLVRALVTHPAHVEDYLRLAVACVVTAYEDQTLKACASDRWGWDRYLVAGIEVMDMLTGTPLDLEAAFAEQARLRASLPAPPVGPRPGRLR